jgi:hypothetical protein
LPNRGVIPAGTTRTWVNLAPRQYHELTMASFDSADVNISLHHSTFTGNVTLRVEWSTDYPTDWEGDSVVFHVDEPDAIIPGQLVYQVTEDPEYGSTGPYTHFLEIPELPCDSSKKYYLHIEHKATGALTTQISPVYERQSTRCIEVDDPGDIHNPSWP